MDIPANQTFTTVILTPRDDTRRENTETAIFTIQPNPGYVIGTNPSATLRIIDNDGPNVARAALSAPAGSSRLLFPEDPIERLILP